MLKTTVDQRGVLAERVVTVQIQPGLRFGTIRLAKAGLSWYSDRELARRKPQGFSPGGPVRPAPWLGRRAFPRLPVPEARHGPG